MNLAASEQAAPIGRTGPLQLEANLEPAVQGQEQEPFFEQRLAVELNQLAEQVPLERLLPGLQLRELESEPLEFLEVPAVKVLVQLALLDVVEWLQRRQLLLQRERQQRRQEEASLATIALEVSLEQVQQMIQPI
jgi:hypothetical protein